MDDQSPASGWVSRRFFFNLLRSLLKRLQDECHIQPPRACRVEGESQTADISEYAELYLRRSLIYALHTSRYKSSI